MTRAPSFWVIPQQILIRVDRGHQVGVDDLSDGGDLVYVGLREGIGHTFVGPQGTQASGHSAHHEVGLPVVSTQTSVCFIQVRQAGIKPQMAVADEVFSKLPWS